MRSSARAVGLAESLAARGALQEAAALAELLAPTADDPLATWLIAVRSRVWLSDGAQLLRVAQQLPKRLLCVEGYAHFRLGDARLAEELLTQGLEELVGVERCEGAFYLAIFLWSERRLDEAEAVVQKHLPNAHGLARASLEQMLGWVEVGRERFPIAARHFERALCTYTKSGERYEKLHGRLLQAVSISALEAIDLALLPSVDVEPPADLGCDAREAWFHAMQNRGWLLMLAGRQRDALNAFLTARALANSPATASVAEVNLASFYRIVGAPGVAREYLQFARRHLRAQQWSQANADERMTLLEYAFEAQKLEPTTAGETLTRYLSSSGRRRGDLAFENDRRVAAITLTARGSLEAIHERRSGALAALGKALEIWSQLGYRYREALTALLMCDVDGDPKHLAVAARALVSAPRSWLYREVKRRKSVSSSVVQKLSPAERRIMLAIYEGKTTQEIAQQFGRSSQTIRNQTVKVYAAMRVHTRSAFIAEGAKLGLIRRDTTSASAGFTKPTPPIRLIKQGQNMAI